jgi:hypothetical protein
MRELSIGGNGFRHFDQGGGRGKKRHQTADQRVARAVQKSATAIAKHIQAD